MIRKKTILNLNKFNRIVFVALSILLVHSCGYTEVERKKDIALIFDYTKIENYYVELVYNVVDTNHANKTISKIDKVIFKKDSVYEGNAFKGVKKNSQYFPRNNAYSGEDIKIIIRKESDETIIEEYTIKLENAVVETGYYKNRIYNTYLINPLSKSVYRVDYVPYGGKEREIKSQYFDDRIVNPGYIENWFKYKKKPPKFDLNTLSFDGFDNDFVIIKSKKYEKLGIDVPRIYLHK